VVAKAPAGQFYWADWLRDTELQAVSAPSRGIWINLLCHMWFAENRGKIVGTQAELTRLANCTEHEFANFLHEVARKRFGNVSRRHDEVTLKSRRMIRDEIARQATNERVKKHRCNAGVTVMKQKCNNTLHSSSSSSVTKVTNTSCKRNKKRVVFKESEREYKAAVYLHNKILETLPNLKKPNLQKWAVDFDKIFRIDERPADEVKRLIDFIYADDFWQTVVQSPSGLRNNYDKAFAKMAKQSKEVSTSSMQEALECKQAYLKQGVTCVNYRNGEKKYDYCIHCSW